MLKKIYGAALIGTKGVLVRCEADVEQGFPTITFIGSLAASVREAADRVRTALGNSGFHLEPRRVTLNLSPAELRKEGCAYDLPIAVSLLAAYGELPENLLTDTLFAGELSLSGEILPVRGVLSMVRCAAAAGLKRCFLPLENLREGSVIGGIDCYGVSTLAELSALLRGRTPLPEPAVFSEESLPLEETPDFSDLAGQELVKRATLLAAGGRHNILYIGPAGTGKSMIASRLPYILPAMSREERLSVSEIYSISGLLPPDRPLMTKRPYRSPHHTVTGLALSGGGQKPRPGEISLAHEGVLFLDELPEYHAATLEVLRQPLEEHLVHIARVSGNYTFPANFQLVCAMNPCKCGFWPDRNRCRCTESQVRTYLSHISKPLLDRIDLCAETEAVPFAALQQKKRPKENPVMQRAVERVRNIQERRFQGSGIHFNAEMSPAQIEAYCSLCPEDSAFLESLYNTGAMSARALHKLLKVARTAADFDGSAEIQRAHLAEALAYRSPEEKYWGVSPNWRVSQFDIRIQGGSTEMERRALYLYLSCELRLTRAEVRKLPGDICAPEDLLHLPDSFLDTLPPGLQRKLDQLPDTVSQFSAALRELEEALYIRHIRFLTAEDADWPERFSTLEDPPLWLYLRGELPTEYTPTVAMIGSRSASSYGLRMADFIASELAAKGVSIVSGLAAGIDSRAEEAAIEAGGKSFAVLGCGVNICYPKENYALFSKLCENGNGILSEFPPDTASRAWHFPDRNRLIAALGDCLCVLEAREQQSGSSITVGSALEQGKEIFCLPGRITDPLSRGCHVFIQNGANLLQSPQDILDYLGLRLRCMLTPRTRSVEALSPEEQHLYRLIREEACFLNRLLQRSGYDIGTVMRCLLKLELEGYIEQLSANYYSVC